ncbi:hypothetical protein [Sphingobacterium kyonggiense]
MRQQSLATNTLTELTTKRKCLLCLLAGGAMIMFIMIGVILLYFVDGDLLRFPIITAVSLFSLLPIYLRLSEVNQEIKNRFQKAV